VENYAVCWSTPLPNGQIDAAVCDVDTLPGQEAARWSNYYVEGLNFLVQHAGRREHVIINQSINPSIHQSINQSTSVL
jgi:hypothetical protein